MAVITIDKLIQHYKSILEKIPETVESAIYENEKQIIQLQKNQLYDGKSNTGEDLHPLYTEDPYFKTQGQAKGYIRYKQMITPNPRRNPNAPNLYINGYIHRNIRIVKESGNITFDFNSNVDFAESVKAKYDNLLGLNPTNQEQVNNELIIPKIWELLES